MPLQPQTVPVILGGGIDTKHDEKVVQAGKLLVLENAVQPKPGTISKRYGSVALSKKILGSTSLITGPKRLGTFGDELVQFTSSKVYSYVPSNDAWADRGDIAAVAVKTKQVIRNTASQLNPDAASTKGVTVYAWEDSRGGVRATVVDQSSGLPLQSDVLVSSTGSRPKCTATSDYIYVHFMDASNAFKCVRLDPQSPLAFGGAVSLASDANGTTPHFDIAPHGKGLVFCYHTTGNVVKTGYLKQDGSIASPTDGYPSPVSSTSSGSGCVAIASRFQGDSNDAIYTFINNTTDGLKVRIHSLDLGSVTVAVVDSTTSVVDRVTALVDGFKCRVWYEMYSAQTYNMRIKSDCVTRAGVVSSGGTGIEYIRSLGIASKPFFGPDGKIYMVAVHESVYQPTFFTLRDISTSRAIVANTIAKDEAGGLHTKRSHACNVTALDASNFVLACTVKTQLVVEAGAIYGLVGLQSSVLSFDDTQLFISKELGKNLHIAGGLLQVYDGRTVFEQGFNLFPENMTVATTTSAGSIEAGTREYVAVYSWTDAQGLLHQSAESIPISVTNSANDKNTLTIPTLRVTERKPEAGRTAVSVNLYRTLKDGTIFYRVNPISSPTLNDVNADSVTINDTLSDAVIASNELLYTDGGILENIQAKSARAIFEFSNRLVTVDLDDAGLAQFSKESEDSYALGFSDSFLIRCDKGGGRLQAGGELDGKMILFKEESAFYMTGQGPNKLGQQNDFQTPQPIPGDVGTPYPQSVCETPKGILFKSAKGYYLLDRSLNFQYVGAEAEGFNSLSVTSAVLVKDANEVRITHSDGVCLVYDYLLAQWRTFTNVEAVDAKVWQNAYCLLQTDGTVLKESKSTYLQAGAPVSTRIVTPWISAAGIQGYQRLWRVLLLGTYESSHRLRIQVSYDFDPSVREQWVFEPDAILGSEYFGQAPYYGASKTFGAVDKVYQVEICPKIQKCQSFKLEIDDLNPEAVDGAGFTLTSMMMVLGVKQGAFKIASKKRVSPS